MNTLGMFARRPEPGRTKTRLAAAIGDQSSAVLYSAFVEDLMERCCSLAESYVVAVTPHDPETSDWYRGRLPAGAQLLFQPAGDLGDRIEWFFETALRTATKVVLIGSDSPDLPGSIIGDAFQRLNRSDVVLGPASDGGFVLIGLAVPPGNIFQNIRWSAVTTLQDTIAACRDRELSVELLQPWYDIDVVENLGAFLSLQQIPGAGSEECPRTRAVLESLWPDISARQ